jgi:hypothetical protein
MKPLIFAYKHNNITYYAEGYTEESIRFSVEKKLNLQQGTLQKGRKPDYNKELKEIWNKNNPKMRLLLTKEQTTSKDEIDNNKKKQHCLYELDLLLSEDKAFLSGINDITITDSNLEVKLYPNTGHVMAYEGKLKNVNDIYRFPNGISDAYRHVRKNIINLGLGNELYKKSEITNLEMCDSMICGYSNPDSYDFNNSKPNNSKREVLIPLGMLSF